MRLALAALMLAVALTGCREPAAGNDEPRPAVTLAYVPGPHSTLVHIAIAKNYFADEGLDARTAVHSHGKAALRAVQDGKADFATAAETPVMFAILGGEKISVIANIEASSTNNAIVARTDAGIAKAADLRGKRVGFTPGTTSDFFLDSLLTANGLTRQNIEPVALPPGEMQEAIAAKRVDAVSTWNYELARIRRRLGAAGTTFYDPEIYTETFNVAVRQEFVDQHPEAVRRFLRALVKAESFAANHPDAAQAIMATAAGGDIDMVREAWSAFSYQVALDQTLLIALEDETRWAMNNGLTAKTDMPDYLRYIHADSLKAVKPDAVRIGR